MRLSKYTNIIRKDDRYLLHNALYNSVIRINNRELFPIIDRLFESNNFVSDYGEFEDFMHTLENLNILVEDDTDEDAILNSRFFHFEHQSELFVMLIVTRRCNFRCPYCYEVTSDNDMPESVYRLTRDFIINQVKTNHFRQVHISFFGGEPTLKRQEIIQFMEKLQDANSELPEPAKISAMMTTNGYLLTEEWIRRFVDLGIIRYQITIDGMENAHNKSRFLVGGEGSWKKIVENTKVFKTIDNPELSVLVRCNITPECYSEIDEWLNYLHDNFSERIYRFHFEVAKNYGKMNDSDFSLLQDESKVLSNITNKAKKLGLNLELVGFRTDTFSLVCYAARKFAFIIDYDGTVKKCTSSSLDEPYNCIGSIHEGGLEISEKKVTKWTSYELNDHCRKCDILPICYMRKCPAVRDQFSTCDFLVKSYYEGLEYSYL